MKKRVVAMMMVGCMAAALMAGCGNGGNDQPAADSTPEASAGAETESDAEPEEEAPTESAGGDYGEYSADNPLELKLSHFASNEQNQLALFANAFKTHVEADTNGAVVVTIYGGGTLGNDQESLDSVIAGTLDCAVNNTPIMAGYADGLSVLDLPYLFENYDDIYTFLDSDVCNQMKDDFAETGARILGMQCVGFRNFESSKGFVKTPADLTGVKTRVTGSEVYVNTWNTWGANAMTLAGPEVITALQQGTIDACDNVNNVCFADGYQEYASYITVMEYATHFNCITMNESKYAGLTPDLQAALTKAASDAAVECTKNLETLNAEQLQLMVDGGAQMSEDVDKEAFREAAQPVYDEYLAKSTKGAEYYEAIEALK